MNSRLILASGSRARAEMLRGAGLEFDIIPADIDESAVQQDRGKSPCEMALALAQQKALHVAAKNPDALVIGGDQVLSFEGEIMAKAATPDEAREKLRYLSGKTHTLISAAALARDGELLWSYADEAHLHMHELDEAFLEDYIAKAGAALTRSVGAYELEAHGAWLFSAVEGDYFTVLGLPLLPLLGHLRTKEGIGL